MEDLEAPIKVIGRPYGRSQAALNKSLEFYRTKWTLVKPELIALKRKVDSEGVKMLKLDNKIAELTTLTENQKIAIKEAAVETRGLNKVVSSKKYQMAKLRTQIQELKQNVKESDDRLKENEKIKVELAKPSIHNPEYWKSLYLAEIKRKK
tara:strand:- start:2029 stop:2481 length:453 start_codon:yes stop_codon:yes gene_type:complete